MALAALHAALMTPAPGSSTACSQLDRVQVCLPSLMAALKSAAAISAARTASMFGQRVL